MSLTTRELSFIEEGIKSESLCAKKIEAVREDIRDPELRRLADEAVRGCRRAVDRLLGELRG